MNLGLNGRWALPIEDNGRRPVVYIGRIPRIAYRAERKAKL
jgi:hypothetical protein